MSSEQYPAKVKILTPEEVVKRWKELGWGTPPACQHKDTRSVAEGEILFRCHVCGAGRNQVGDWGLPAHKPAEPTNL